MADRLLAGDGLETIARDLNGRKVPNSIQYIAGQRMPDGKTSRGWTAATIRSMLMRSSIMGKRSWKGRLIAEGGWEGVVSEDDWHELQRLLKSRSGKERDGRASHELSGIATCGAKTERAEGEGSRSWCGAGAECMRSSRSADGCTGAVVGTRGTRPGMCPARPT
ncbi:recombinase family protein [Nocardiopsis eucommiae]|uniref:Recombinase family protein n=1 Tax=Nocardiopsis eucommiae TaxID=2831970 RepID=A0A975LD07_9ACTN|nr:recombinase family protein [Nocardiopsis eucommiae]